MLVVEPCADRGARTCEVVGNADPADTSGFDRFAAQGTTLLSLLPSRAEWKKPSLCSIPQGVLDETDTESVEAFPGILPRLHAGERWTAAATPRPK